LLSLVQQFTIAHTHLLTLGSVAAKGGAPVCWGLRMGSTAIGLPAGGKGGGLVVTIHKDDNT